MGLDPYEEEIERMTDDFDIKPKVSQGNSTLFVSSLPYTATTTDLLTHFSFVGPVRHGFIATDKSTGKSKGIGYVTYSLREDAEKALAELDDAEFGDKGRKLRVAWADRRPAPDERVVRQAKRPKVEAEGQRQVDPNATRTLVLTGLPGDLTKPVLWKKVRKVHDGIELQYPIEDAVNTAHLLFPSLPEALNAVPKLHGHTYKGATLSCMLKRRLDKLSQADNGKAPSHAGRLIVRNLAWNVTEQDLRAAFIPYGPIHNITLPTVPSTSSSHPKKRGFAFVWFLERKDAHKAMEGLNGKAIGSADAKDKGKKEGRPVAVDWALSKDKWRETQNGQNDTRDDDEAEGSGSEDSSSVAESSESRAGSADEVSSSEEDEEDQDVHSDSEAEEEEPVKPSLPAVDVGSTLFIRNLPFETTEQELQHLFRSFGPLRYARITMDRETGRSRGSGFVCFWKGEHADAAIAESAKMAQETGANSMPLGGKNPFTLPSVLTADPSSSLTSWLVLHGRTLDVSRAITREDASRIKEAGERARQAGDKRNTYLMREGVIFPNSPAAQNLPEAEVERRQTSFNARRTLLNSNPSLYISKTRLSVRQLPLFATERTLKRLAIHAVRTFDLDVKAGEREALSTIEEADMTLSAAMEARKDGTGKSRGKKGERDTVVIQSKINRQTEKLDPLMGLGKSKGYGFLEMRSHRDALKMLRWANNNPDVGPLLAEWHREELADVLKRTKATLESKRERAKASGAAEKEKEGKDSVEELEGRVRRLETKLADKEAKEGGMRGGKTLLIEFSIENVQVVRRRNDKISAIRSGNLVPKSQREMEKKRKVEDTDDSGIPSGKKMKSNARTKRPEAGKRTKETKGLKEPAPAVSVPEKRGLEKQGAHLGQMIGRKRKMRKMGK